MDRIREEIRKEHGILDTSEYPLSANFVTADDKLVLSGRFFVFRLVGRLFGDLLQAFAAMDLAQPRALRTGNELPGDYQESSAKADGTNHGIAIS